MTRMGKHRSILSVIAVFALMASLLAGCSATGSTADESQTELTKIADNLFEITCTEDFDWGDTTTPEIGSFACSGVQNGPYRGRNYDWIFADTALCVVHTTVTANRPHASVGVADLSFITDEDGTYDMERIPFTVVDGINDAGLCVQVNVMPYGENGELGHTETTADDLAGGRAVRYLLDYAGSVEEALALLEEKDLHSEMDEAEELHWMISGPASETDSTIQTVVAELFPDGLHVTEDFVDDKPIMTNINVSNFDGTPDSAGLGYGYERWQILSENYDQATSVMGMFDLMEKVYYSHFYDLFSNSFWYSEYNGVNLSDYYDAQALTELLGEDTYNTYMENFGGVYYTSALWDGEASLRGDISKSGIIAPAVEADAEAYAAQNKEDGLLWITMHTSVYDLENKTLDIQVRESQDTLHFTIE